MAAIQPVSPRTTIISAWCPDTSRKFTELGHSAPFTLRLTDGRAVHVLHPEVLASQAPDARSR